MLIRLQKNNNNKKSDHLLGKSLHLDFGYNASKYSLDRQLRFWSKA